jgi:protease I
MASALTGKRVAILVEDGCEQTDLIESRTALATAGAHVTLVSPRRGEARSWDAAEWGGSFPVDLELRLADEADFESLLLPGGVMSADQLRTNDEALRFVQAFANAGKPVAAIGHGPQVLIDAGIVRGRTLTSAPSIRRDLINAGAEWIDEPAIVDQGLVTSRSSADVARFNQAMIDEFASSGWAPSP